MTEKTHDDGWLKNAIAIVAVVVSMIGAAAAVRGCNREETRANQNAVRLQEVEEQVKSLKDEVESKTRLIEQQRRDLQRGLDSFALYYRDKVKNAQTAIDRYTSSDTEENRKELGADFDRRQRELLADAKVKLQALVDHVKKWRPVLAALEKALNGRVTALDEQLLKDDVDGILSRFGVLRENVDSDLDRLRQELDKASETLNPTGSKPAS